MVWGKKLTVPARNRAKVIARIGARSIFLFSKPITSYLSWKQLMMKRVVCYLMLFFLFVVLIFEQVQSATFRIDLKLLVYLI